MRHSGCCSEGAGLEYVLYRVVNVCSSMLPVLFVMSSANLSVQGAVMVASDEPADVICLCVFLSGGAQWDYCWELCSSLSGLSLTLGPNMMECNIHTHTHVMYCKFSCSEWAHRGE